jgi:hypothetical protein
MIVRDKTNEIIERRKTRLGLSGDVYIFNSHFIESLESHKRLIPNSTAATIEEAYDERVAYEEEQERRRAEEAARAAEAEEEHSDDENTGDGSEL